MVSHCIFIPIALIHQNRGKSRETILVAVCYGNDLVVSVLISATEI